MLYYKISDHSHNHPVYVKNAKAGHCKESRRHLNPWLKDQGVAALWTEGVGEKRVNFKPARSSTLYFKRHFLYSYYYKSYYYKSGTVQFAY